MKASYVVISLFSIVLGIVIIPLKVSVHESSAPLPAPTVALQVPDSNTVQAAPTDVPAPAVAVPEPQKRVEAPIAAPIAPPTPISAPAPVAPSRPVQLVIPSIALTSPVEAVTVNEKGEMAVPSGTTNKVGWYSGDGGVLPGDVGTAVMDAHVFAAFHKLHDVRIGDDIYVDGVEGRMHFVVTATRTYALSELTSSMLFQETDGRHLNLITCAGNLTPDHSTYDHRLIIYATLAQ
jgi:LPXTG-site transpeptidase (sortase) family protein